MKTLIMQFSPVSKYSPQHLVLSIQIVCSVFTYWKEKRFWTS